MELTPIGLESVHKTGLLDFSTNAQICHYNDTSDNKTVWEQYHIRRLSSLGGRKCILLLKELEVTLNCPFYKR